MRFIRVSDKVQKNETLVEENLALSKILRGAVHLEVNLFPQFTLHIKHIAFS